MSILKNFAYKSILNIVTIVIPIVIMPYVYRCLTPNDIGNLEYSMTIMSYFSILGGLGIYNYGLRELSKHKTNLKEAHQIYSNLVTIGIFSNLICSGIFYLFIIICVDSVELRSLMFIVGITILGNIFNVEWANEAFEEFRFITIRSLVIRLISLILIFAIVKNEDDLFYYASITIGTNLVNNIIGFLHITKRLKFRCVTYKLTKVISSLLIILILNNVFILYINMDITLLGYFTSETNVAYFSVPYKIMTIIYSAIMVVMYVSYPKLSLYIQTDYDNYLRLLKNAIRSTMFIVFPTAIGLSMLSKEIIILFAGDNYIPCVEVLRVCGAYMIISSFLSIYNHQIMFINGHERTSVIYFFIYGIINIMIVSACRNILTPSLALIITGVTQIFLCFSLSHYSYKKFKIFHEVYNVECFKYLIYSLIFIPLILIIKGMIDNYTAIIITSVIICGLTYFAILYFSKDYTFINLINRVYKK